MGARRSIVRWIAPSYTVGAVCVIERDDGRILLVEQAYREGWGIPGGLVGRGEDIADAARREVREEIGIEVELLGPPAVVVDPVPRRVDVIHRARPATGTSADDARPVSAEIVAVGWFLPAEMPELQIETVAVFDELARHDRRGT